VSKAHVAISMGSGTIAVMSAPAAARVRRDDPSAAGRSGEPGRNRPRKARFAMFNGLQFLENIC
jgi:hypothetical protein